MSHLTSGKCRTQCGSHVPPLLSLHAEEGVSEQGVHGFVHKDTVVTEMVEILDGELLEKFRVVYKDNWRPHVKHSNGTEVD